MKVEVSMLASKNYAEFLILLFKFCIQKKGRLQQNLKGANSSSL
jgi:hypothetical protein